MSASSNQKFRIALSSDFQRPDGSLSYPMFDLAPLQNDERIEMEIVTATNGEMSGDVLKDFDALILLAPKFTRSSVVAESRLAVVARFGVGYDTVDVDACTEFGIGLAITPDGVRRPAAVSIITLMLALTSKLMVKDQLTRQGAAGFAQRSEHMGLGLIRKTLGSLGVGNIGAELFRLAAPFDLQFIAHDPYLNETQARELNLELVSLDELFLRSDILSINCPLTESTRHIVSTDQLATMKPTAYLINTARGPVVDQTALTKALQEQRIAGAGLDVLETEPPPLEDPILQLDNVILTPHALCWTDQCFAGIGAADVKAVLAVMQGHVPVGLVNQEVLEHPNWQKKLANYRSRFGENA
ncbi:MAG: NAD(P)-dependent oxidoreductase [SAR324 cluster bacterium]|nr:NAD(P)-dependent oxidoreductase [SAR324 cluster bacterium]